MIEMKQEWGQATIPTIGTRPFSTSDAYEYPHVSRSPVLVFLHVLFALEVGKNEI